MLEQQFYLNVHKAKHDDYRRIGVAFSKIMKGGSPQFWRLISREMEAAHK